MTHEFKPGDRAYLPVVVVDAEPDRNGEIKVTGGRCRDDYWNFIVPAKLVRAVARAPDPLTELERRVVETAAAWRKSAWGNSEYIKARERSIDATDALIAFREDQNPKSPIEELRAAIKDLRAGDTLVVWRLDRLARSMRQLYSRLDQIYAKGASFKSLTEQFDFGTVSGKFILGILGLVAEFERQIIAQRTQAGIAALKSRKGKEYKWGRKLHMTPERVKLVGDYLNGRNGKKRLSGPKIAAKMKVSTASIYGYWKQTGKGVFVRRRPQA